MTYSWFPIPYTALSCMNRCRKIDVEEWCIHWHHWLEFRSRNVRIFLNISRLEVVVAVDLSLLEGSAVVRNNSGEVWSSS